MSRTQPFQANNEKGWQWMTLYWVIGMVVGQLCGYWPLNVNATVDSLFSYEKLVGLVVTLGVCPRFLSRYDNFGRSRNLFAPFIFAICNGISETFLFLATYDLGAKWMVSFFSVEVGASSWMSAALGLFTFSIYSGLIHVLLWLPRGFPQHTKPDASPFHKKGLPEVLTMSLCWLWLYESTGDILYVCFLHFVFNIIGTWYMGLQFPDLSSAQSMKAKNG